MKNRPAIAIFFESLELSKFRSGTERAFIICFNYKTGHFSKALEVEGGSIHGEASGENLYLTGKDFRSISKTKWPLTETFNKEPVFKSADTVLGKAAIAFFKKDYGLAAKLVSQVIKKDPLSKKLKSTLKGLEKLNKGKVPR